MKIQKKRKKSEAPSVRVRTLGCKVNFCDGRALAQTLVVAGFRKAAKGLPADVEIVNTCSVTARSVQKARSLIRSVRKANPSCMILVTGCAARVPENAFSGVPEADKVCPSAEEVFFLLKERYGVAGAPLPAESLDLDRTRAFIKIQDGCQAFCAYCIVPLARSVCRSLDPPGVLRLVAEAVDRGYREVVICGIHLGHYGRGLKGVNLASVLRDIAAIGGQFRVRLSSIEPLEVTQELLEVISSGDRFCPHLHLPLQSGSDRVLAAMGRPYRMADYARVVARARETLNNPAITTDIMVGFPGETEEDHRLTMEAIREIGFARSHVFIYSPRPGTRAAGMPGRITGPLGRSRSLEAREAGARTATAYRKTLIGTTEEVVVESDVEGAAEGFCRRYQRVRFHAGKVSLGEAVPVKILGEDADGVLEGRLA